MVKIVRPLFVTHGNLLNSYAKPVTKAYGRTGSLFQHPFGRMEVTTETYLRNLVTAIHQNPQRHGLVTDFRLWPTHRMIWVHSKWVDLVIARRPPTKQSPGDHDEIASSAAS